MARPKCGATAQFYDEEAVEAECALPAGHPGKVHEDLVLGEWDEDDVYTVHPIPPHPSQPAPATSPSVQERVQRHLANRPKRQESRPEDDEAQFWRLYDEGQ